MQRGKPTEVIRIDWTDFGGIRKGIRLPIRGGEPAQHMFARKHMLQMCRARSSVASLSSLCSVARPLYAEVDLTDAVVDLVKQGHHSGVSVAISWPTHPSNPKPGDHYLPNRRDKTA